ncbi:MAG: hypothetical protein LH606_06555 [Cytophagaceae bacterium]|nr:hypothetical protein [Cytophagaceae bacterium]
MKAIEFEAEIQNGLIAIPEQYPEFKRGRVKVIVLQDEKEAAYKKFLEALDAANKTAAQYPELSEMTMEEITAIVKEVRRGEK